MNVASSIATEKATPLEPAPRRLTRSQKIVLGLLPIAVAGGIVLSRGGGTPVNAAPPPATVTAAAPIVRQITEWDDYLGRFEASRSVEVRPRVSGAVTGVHFTDGAIVRKGQLLFTIDPRPFTAALAEAQAAVQSAQSALALARADLGRATRLLEVDAVSRSDVDRIRARVQAGQATLAAAQARVRSRALDVSFTQVRAPITGRISDRRVDAGNLVAGGPQGGEATLLTTINALDPVYFTFDASESLYLKARRARESGAASTSVAIRLQDETDYKWRGRLDFTDNSIDNRSGTIRLRAVVGNPNQFLTPGMFGNLRLAAGGTTDALMVPDEAVQTDQARKVVTVVAPDGSLSPRPVVVGPLLDGLRVIRSGLAPTDRVVIAGAQLAMPGTTVKVKQGVIRPAVAAAAPAPPNQPAGEATYSGR